MITAEQLHVAGYRAPTGIQMTSTEATDLARNRVGLPTTPAADQQHVDELTAEIAAAQVLDNFNRAHANYLAARDVTPTWRDRLRDGLDSAKIAVVVLWPHISHAAIALGLIVLTAIGCLAGCMVAR